MVVGFLKNVEAEFGGEKKKFKAGTLAFPFLPRLEITLSQNKKENMTSSDPLFYIGMNKAKGYAGPKSRIGALWIKKVEKQASPKFGQEYLSGNIETPVVPGGTLYISVFKVEEPKEGEKSKEWDYEILWTPSRPQREDNSYGHTDTYIPESYEEIIDEGEELNF